MFLTLQIPLPLQHRLIIIYLFELFPKRLCREFPKSSRPPLHLILDEDFCNSLRHDVAFAHVAHALHHLRGHEQLVVVEVEEKFLDANCFE